MRKIFQNEGVKRLFNSSKNIEKKLEDYCCLFLECLECFKEGMNCYLSCGSGSDFDFWVNKITKIESQLDTLRREAEYEMYSKSILVESRGDILKILELSDIVPNRLESAMFQLQCEKIVFPEQIRNNLRSMLDYTNKSAFLALDAFQSALNERSKVLQLSKEIDNCESFCDHLERRMVTDVFHSDLETGEKILLKMFLSRLGKISDSAQRIAEFSIIMSVKGRI